MNTTANNILQFQVGKTYSTRSACDWDCIFSFTIVRRTATSVWIEYHGKINRRRVFTWNANSPVEFCYPLGKYSMAPVINANSTEE